MKRYDYAPVSDDAPIPDPLVESTDGDWCDAQEALAAIAALTAENARLLNEVKAWKATADARTARVIALESEQRDYEQTCVRLNGENARLRGEVETADQIAEARAIHIACLESENERLEVCINNDRANIAALISERDELRSERTSLLSAAERKWTEAREWTCADCGYHGPGPLHKCPAAGEAGRAMPPSSPKAR